jgi:uncharacterized protein (DUF1919 family)
MLRKLHQKYLALLFKIQQRRRTKINVRRQKGLINRDVSILSCDCTAGGIYRDLGLKFLSPTINLYFSRDDFCKFALNLSHYSSLNLLFPDELQTESFPVGLLGDIKIYFMHYQNAEEARAKWYERSKRINPHNIFVIMTDTHPITPKTVELFKAISYPKILLCSKSYSLEEHEWVIRKKAKALDKSYLAPSSLFSWKRFYDFSPFVSWLNQGQKDVKKTKRNAK